MSGDITRWLALLREGDQQALDHLVPVLYDELRGLAAALMQGERPGHTLSATALVHEAYLRLSRERRIGAEDRGQFFAVAATVMRRILVDSARRRLSAKRGAGARQEPLDAVDCVIGEAEVDELVAIEEALDRLETAQPRARQVFDLRVFAGLGVDETAGALGVNERTVRRDWLFARAWMRRALGREALPER